MTRNRIYLALVGLLCVALAALLAAGAIGIYREGAAIRAAGDPLAWIYTRERVVQRLAAALPVGLIALGLALAGLILGVRDPRAERPVRSVAYQRDLLAARVKAPSEAMLRQARLQRRYALAGRTAFGACMVPVFAYLLDAAHFPVDGLEGMFSRLLWGIAPWTALGLACLMLFAALRDRSTGREIEAARERLAEERSAGENNGIRAAAVPEDDRLAAVLRAALIFAAMAMIAAGIANGGARDVLVKAINLCTECVGLG